MRYSIYIVFSLIIFNKTFSQTYWQQRVEYEINIDFDADKHQFSGKEVLTYTNNSPDTLDKVFFHLYYNAFQPGSMMQWHRHLNPNPDTRFPLMDSLANLQESEIGYHKVRSLTQEGTTLEYEVTNTILEVVLSEPILPGASTTFGMEFDAQVPLQVRRTGRDSFEGIDYSMAQWFPKMAEYDPYGWHAHPYVDHEFYGVWGDYEVNITIDKKYVLAGTGIVQNPNEVGYGYEDEGVKVKRRGKKLTWKFKAENVHDFVWAADTKYVQTTAQVPDGPLLRFFYVDNPETELWNTVLPEYSVKCFEYTNENFGKYGWDQYSIIQGGDGGMEYLMATLIMNKKRSGVRSFNSLIGVMVHESMHSWYQGMMATNESYYPWMDEGFATYVEDYVMDHILETNLDNPNESTINRYIRWANSGREEAASIHSDYFTDYPAYAMASYYKGGVALAQLNYIIGEKVLHDILVKYRNQWAFKHPHPNDFIRLAEKESGLQLRWFFDHWINTVNVIDYGVKEVSASAQSSKITLEKLGEIPMPLEVTVTKTDGTKVLYYIPNDLMRGNKVKETSLERVVLGDWFWTHPEYTFTANIPVDQIKKVEIDESNRLADVYPDNNIFTIDEDED